MQKLTDGLRRIDGRGYPAYKDLRGSYSFPTFDLDIVHVQGDPFAAPSRLAVYIPLDALELDDHYLNHPSRRIGLEDGIRRSFARVLAGAPSGRGSGKSGQWGFLRPQQQIVQTTSCEVLENDVCLRFTLGLPAQGRRVLGREAHRLLTDVLPQIVSRSVLRADPQTWYRLAEQNEDQDFLRRWLEKNQHLAFIANGATLPRESGVDDRPLQEGAIPWQSPEDLEQTLTLPNHGDITGSVFSRGIHLICGGGYHGKSTLLQAIARGIYNHIPGDGREFCVTRNDAVSVRAEDGRAITHCDISPFIGELPNGKSTRMFCTQNASGSTSQAANIVEALELGTHCLLIDEDTSATNFMVRDRRMQELIKTEREPITPFIDRIQQLLETLDVSSILVVGGSGDYFEVCDSVLVMDSYRPQLMTEQSRQIVSQYPANRIQEARSEMRKPRSRTILLECFDASRGRKQERVRANKTRSLDFGEQEIDLSMIGQLVDSGQARLIGDWLLEIARGLGKVSMTLEELCSHFESICQQDPLSNTLSGRIDGDRVFARRFEFGSAINRLRQLKAT